MKFRYVLGLGAAIVALMFMLLLAASAQAQPQLDLKLGSKLFDTDHRGNLPFYGDLIYQHNYLIGGIGHQSNADLAGDETHADYGLVGLRPCNTRALLFCQIAYKRAFTFNDYQEVYSGEVGLRQGNFRFTYLYEQDGDGQYRISVLAFNFTIHLLRESP